LTPNNDDKQTLVDAIANEELPSLWRFALQLTHHKQDAEDLVQRTCVRAMEQSDQYIESGKLRSWLFRLAHNIWRNELRSRAVRQRGDLMAVNPGCLENAELYRDNATPETRLEFQQVVAAVETLPEGQRLVTQLICVNGFTYAETASILDIAVGTVMSRLARARVAMGQRFLNDMPVKQTQKITRTGPIMSPNMVRQ